MAWGTTPSCSLWMRASSPWNFPLCMWKGDPLIHLLRITVTVLLPYTLNSHPFPKLRKKHSLCLSHPLQSDPLVIPRALFWTLSSATTRFLYCWEGEPCRFRKMLCNVHCTILHSFPPNSLCHLLFWSLLSWHFNGSLHYIPKILFLNSNTTLWAYSLSVELVLFLSPSSHLSTLIFNSHFRAWELQLLSI